MSTNNGSETPFGSWSDKSFIIATFTDLYHVVTIPTVLLRKKKPHSPKPPQTTD